MSDDEELMAKSNSLAEEVRNKFWTLVIGHVVPAIDQSKVDCKDGIIMPDGSEVSSLILPG